MEFTDVVRSRRMIRRFDPDRTVPRETIAALLDLATRSPSAGFSQGWHFLVLTDPADLDLYWTVTAPAGPADAWLQGLRTAPVLVLALSDPQRYAARYAEPDKAGSSLSTSPTAGSAAGTATGTDTPAWPVPWWDVDTGMAVLAMLLGAVDAGLGGCLAGIPAGRWAAVRAAFDLPDRLRPGGLVALGFPAPGVTGRRGRHRRPVAEVVSWSRYGRG